MIKLILIGNLTKDPALRVANTQDGQRNVADFTVACNGRRDKTTFVRVSVWDALAENCAKYLSKGRKVCCISNDVQARTYTMQDGTTRMSIECTASEVEFLSPANAQQQGDADDGGYAAMEPQDKAPVQQAKPQPKAQEPKQTAMEPVNFADDDLPF